MLTEDDILNALKACFDPGNPYGRRMNLVELGCVESISLVVDTDAPGYGIAGVPARQRLQLSLVSCSTEEDARAQLRAQVANMLAGLPEISRSEVLLLDEPTWSEARLSPEARRLIAPAPFAILNNRR